MIKFLLVFSFLLFCSPQKLFSKDNSDYKSFKESYQNFQNIREKDRSIDKITKDISLFLEAKKDFYEGRKSPSKKSWLSLFQKNPAHMKDEFIELWTELLKSESLETETILSQAKSYKIMSPVKKILIPSQKKKNTTSKQIKNFIRENGLEQRIPINPRENLTKKTLLTKSKKSLLHKVLLLVALEEDDDQEEVLKLAPKLEEELRKVESLSYLVFPITRIKAKTMRHTGLRREAAKTYQNLCLSWDRFPSENFPSNIKQDRIKLDEANDCLWSARYNALIGKKKIAEKHSDKAMRLLQKLRKKKLSPLFSAESKELLLEAYYVKSFRIALYFGEWAEGLKWSEKALKIYSKRMKRKWLDHFTWLKGLSHYFLGNHKEAHTSWKSSLKRNLSLSSQEKRLYWLTQTSEKLKRKKEKAQYESRLLKEHPFAFYTTHYLGKTPKIPASLQLKVKISSEEKQKLNPKNKLLVSMIRSEILIESGLIELAKGELDNSLTLTKPRKFNQKNLDFYLYLSRLLKSAELYRKSIWLTGVLGRHYRNFWSKNPEALKTYYPEAFKEKFSQTANEYSVTPSLLYAIARRESLFDPEAESAANALGLMQVTPKTGKEIAKKLQLKTFEPKEDLKKVDHNLLISGSYVDSLIDYHDEDLVKVISSYNAGEFCTDQWSKIPQEDQKLWIELIPFSETRKYIKAVLSSMKIYEKILDHSKEEKANLLRYTHALKNITLFRGSSKHFFMKKR